VCRTLPELGAPSGETARTLRAALRLSLVASGLAMAVILTFGAALAYLLARRSFAGGQALDTLVDLPIVLPLAAPSLAAGAVLAWARALGEFGATIMFAGNDAGRTQTMPLAIYGRYEAGDLPTALAHSLCLLGGSAAVLLAARIATGVAARRDRP
jgi:ABC-type sulfate transport system permease component